jgi:hypothetical protein
MTAEMTSGKARGKRASDLQTQHTECVRLRSAEWGSKPTGSSLQKARFQLNYYITILYSLTGSLPDLTFPAQCGKNAHFHFQGMRRGGGGVMGG